MAASTTKRKRGRPRKPDSEKRRNNVTFRMRDSVKKRLQESAANAGRSLSEENEYHLERALLEEETFGGRQFHALFGLLGNAAVLIEQQTGKAYFEDYYTYVAVRAAWQRLIDDFGPSPPAENIVALEQAAAPPVPKLPMLPTPPAPPQQLKDYDAAMVIYKKESAEYKKAGEALRRIVEDVQAQMALGKDVAVSLLPERPKKKA